MNYLHLIRYQNLLFIALVQIFIKVGLFQEFNVDVALSAVEFALLVIATLCIAAGGNIINDVYDVEIDTINRPEKVLIGKSISEQSANRLFIVVNVIGVTLGFYLANRIGRPGFAALFIAISASLYLYASYFKGILLLGNLLISVLVAMSLLIVGLFDLLPAISPENQAIQSTAFEVVLKYAIFAFFINFIREIVKDLEDINGDKKGGLNTLAIAIGRKRTITVVFILGLFLVFGVISQMYIYLYDQQVLMLYFLFGIVAPLLYFCIKAWSAKHKRDYAFLSKLLKIVMVLGICSLMLLRFAVLG